MASLLFPKWHQFELSSGAPAASYWLHFLTTGTSTPKDAYSDVTAATPIANPYQLNSSGRPAANIFISGTYRVVLHSTNDLLTGTSIADVDPVEDGVRASAFQASSPTYGGNNSGTATALVFAMTPAITSYTAGSVFRGRITADITGAATINWGGGVKSLVKQDGTALASGDAQGPGIITWVYDATTDVARLQSPDGHLFRNGSNEPARVDVADGATVNLSPATINSRYARLITSTTAITAVTLPDGNVCNVLFNTARTLTNGASLILPGGADITTAAGDTATFIGEASGVVRCVSYTAGNAGPTGLLSTTTASNSATVDIALPAGFARYTVKASKLRHATDTTILWLRVSTDGGSTYAAGASDYNWYNTSGATITQDLADSELEIGGGYSGVDNSISAASVSSVVVEIPDAADATYHKVFEWTSIQPLDNAGTLEYSLRTGGGAYVGAASAITHIRFLASSGNLSTGTFKLYGYR